MKSKTQRSLPVRVEHEPNRFSSECLEGVYARLHPVDSRDIRSGRDQQPERDRRASRKALGARR